MSSALMRELEALAHGVTPEQPPAMLSLSDEELNAIISLARPIEAAMRDAFLRGMAKELARYRDSIGPGLIFRVGKQLQREFLRPPAGHVAGLISGIA